MGIPYYFQNIITQYDCVVIHHKTGCDRLYIDFNCIVHQSAMNHTSHDAIIDASIAYIDNLCQITNPTDLVYIAVGGVCSRAKMNQQRKRVYMSLWQKKYLDDESVWDGNSTTPGTEFMDKMDYALMKYSIGNTMCKIICSPSVEMGEGDYKIIHHLRTQTPNSNKNVIVYGLDPDMILLALVLQAEYKNITLSLIRETQEFDISSTKSELYSLDISQLIYGIDNTFCPLDDSFTTYEKIREFVMLTIFLGNDFLPPLSCLNTNNGGLDILCGVYACTREVDKCMRFILPNKSINWTCLDEFMRNLQKNEEAYYIKASDDYYNCRPYYQNSSMSDKHYYLENFTSLNKFQSGICASHIGWRKEYNKMLFPHVGDIVDSACHIYTDGIEWNTEYYFKGIIAPMSSWYYPHPYSPTIKDVSDFISIRTCTRDYVSLAFVPKIYSTIMQMLIVMPPESIKRYLPAYTQLLTDPEFECMDMYPMHFQIMTYLKSQIWECLPILPDIHEERLEKGIEILRL